MLEGVYQSISCDKLNVLFTLMFMSRHESLEQDHLTEVERLKKELSHANDLLASLRQQRGAMLSDTEVLSLSPAAAKASAMLKSGQSLTQIYSQYVEVCMYVWAHGCTFLSYMH